MIIECINCNKKFNVDPGLIPEDGRSIQCGSCSHSWFYKMETPISKPLVLDQIKDQNIDLDQTASINIRKSIIKENNDDQINQAIKTEKKIETKTIGNFFSYLIVLIISFVALIILINTLKLFLIDIFPGLEFFLFNFFEIIKDIKLFIIDLT